MKSKNKKGKGDTSRHSEEDLAIIPKSSAFTFLKNRFFLNNAEKSVQSNTNNNSNNTSPRLSTSSSGSLATSSKPWSIDNHSLVVEKPLSRSFEEQQETKPTNGLCRNNRPVSMMGMDLLLDRKTTSLASPPPPVTIQVAPIHENAYPMPRRRNSSHVVEEKKRASLIIVKEGYLFKKTDFKPFHKHSKLDRGWKLYRVVLRGHKLYLYKLTTESPLKSLFPLQHQTSSSSLLTTANSLSLVSNDFDLETQKLLFSPNTLAQGSIFMELNAVTLQQKNQIYLVLSNDGILYSCHRNNNSGLWKMESKLNINTLKVEILQSVDEIASPTSSIHSNSTSNLHSNGSLLFSISYHHRPSILGVYSTQFRDSGLNWVNLFQCLSTKSTLDTKEEDVLSSSRSEGSLMWRIEEDWDDSLNNSKMYDATQRYHPDLIRNHRSGKIGGGTMNALIHELLFGQDDYVLNVFLLTYSNFTTGVRVLNQLGMILSKNNTVESRLFYILETWCTEFALDIMGDLVYSMVSLLENPVIQDKQKANELKKLVLETVTKNGKKNCEPEDQLILTAEESDLLLTQEEDHSKYEVENISAHDIDGKRRDSINLSNVLLTGLTQDVFLMIDPISFAQQIYTFHQTKYQQFKQELLNPMSYLPRPQLSVQMLNSLLFTTVSPHFITKLIRNQILIDNQQQDIENDMLLRSQLLEHWIRIGVHLSELGDMIGWCAVAMGVCSVGIVRLRETWKTVDRDLVDRVQTDWVRILTDYGLFTQDIWAEGWELGNDFSRALTAEHVVFRDIEKKDCKSIPFFGTIRQAADRLRKHVKLLRGPNIIDWNECKRIYDTITHSLEVWMENQPVEQHDYTMAPLPVVGPLQSYFEHLVTEVMSVPHDFKYLQECSLSREPRIFGQVCDKRKFGGRHGTKSTNSGMDVAPPSTLSLSFPRILDSCSLLDVEHATPISPTLDSSSASFKKSHRMHNSNSIRSIRSFLEESAHKKQSGSSVSTTYGSNASFVADSVVSSPRGVNRKVFRRRTYSFPPGSGNNTPSSASRLELLESENNRTWLGSLISNRHHRTYSTKALIEAHRKSRAAQYGHNGETILSVQQNTLVYKAAAILNKEQEDEHEEASPLKKVGSMHSTDFLKKDEIDQDQDTLLVTIKAGILDHLVDSLVCGVLPHIEELKDQWQMMSLAEGLQHQVQPGKVAMDEEEYIHVFFMTFRIYCSATQLFDLLRSKYLNAKQKCKHSVKKRKNSLILLESYFQRETSQDTSDNSHTTSEIDLYDWKKVADIQLRVLNLMMFWMEEHPYDFIEEVEASRYVDQFLSSAKKTLNEWRTPLCDHDEQDEEKKVQHTEALTLAHTIEQKIAALRTHFIKKSLSPCYDIKSIPFDTESIRGVEELYRQLTSGTKYHTTLQLATNKLIPVSVSSRPYEGDAKSLVDCFAPEALLEQVDKAVRQLFSAVTMQDWMQTFDVFEAQFTDIYAWLPARKPSRTSRMSAALSPVEDAPSSHVPNYHVPLEEVIISDIFTAMEGARRSVVAPSAFSDDDLLLAFPSSIQYLYCMHYIIRSWVVNEIAAPEIDSKTRVLRIEKFLQIVMMSKISSEKMNLFPELKEASPAATGRVPGFVEYAIASALVSPEVRIFTKAWNDVAMQHGHANIDTLENLLNQIQKTQPVISTRTMTASFSDTSIASCYHQLVVPSLGWIFECIMELCFHIPDTFDKKEGMINFDKRRCVYQFLQLIMNVQADLDEQQVEAKGISMSFLISPRPHKESWKNLKELAMRENKKVVHSSMGLRGGSSRLHIKTVFNKSINEHMDKLKRDFKERDRIDKEWLTLQHKLQKKQIEQARQVEKLDRKHGLNKSTTQLQLQPSVIPRLNSFLRGFRPTSMVAAPTQVDFAAHPSAAKASTVINLIHSTTSVASTYTKRDYVFRIVTEEGGQYLFQAMHREDMQEWIQYVTHSAREGAAKRQSVLAADSLDYEHRHPAILDRSQPPSRTSVYGVTLDSLLRDGKVPVVEKCIREIECRGLDEVGIYRVAGTGSVTSALKAEFNKDVDKVDLSDPRWADINVIADALKQFLRELPEPLLTYTYYDEFIKASASEDHDERVYLIKKVIKKLPYSNYILLKRIIEHFVTVTDFEATNHMYATNLAIVFGPTLLQPTPGPASFATTMSNLGHHQNIVKYLILNYHYLFDVESDENEQPTPSEEQDPTITTTTTNTTIATDVES